MSTYASEEFLAAIQEGDEVLVCGDFGAKHIRPVTKVTKTQIVIGTSRYDRKTGNMRGQTSYCRSRIGRLTPEIADEIRRAHYVDLIRRVELSRVQSIPTSTLRLAAIYLGLLDEPIQEQADEPVREG